MGLMIIFFDIICLIIAIFSIILAISSIINGYGENMLGSFIIVIVFCLFFSLCHIDSVPDEGTEIRPKKIEEYVGDKININNNIRQIVDYKIYGNSFILDNGVTIDVDFAKTLVNNNIEAPKKKLGWVWHEKEILKIL